MKNLYVYFWRWATLKVFGAGWKDSTGEAENDCAGIVCYITVAGFLNGPGFQKMRDDLRRDCSDIWVIDCSPEGHQPDVATRIFQGVQQPVCIVLAVRPPKKVRTVPARLHFRALPKGRRDEKFVALTDITLRDSRWAAGPSGWRDPYLPEFEGLWGASTPIQELFEYSGRGVEVGRTWAIAPDRGSLKSRWDALISEADPAKKEVLFRPHEGGDKTSTKTASRGLFGHEGRLGSVAMDTKPVIEPTRYSFRSFDRQWIIPDLRLIHRPNPYLWEVLSSKQVYATALMRSSPSNGPAITFGSALPDLERNST